MRTIGPRVPTWRARLRLATVALVTGTVVALVPAVASAPVHAQETSLASVTGLTVDWQAHPLAVDNVDPMLAWLIGGTERGVLQAAYQVEVASSPELLDADHPEPVGQRSRRVG